LLHGEAGQTYVVETSPDLRAWRPLATNTLPVSPVEVAVLDAASSNALFMRACLP
jgi:hypothetical protein